MTTIACFKWVVSDRDLRIDPATHLLDTSRARREISPYDRNTIEAARRIVEARRQPGTLVGITAGSITPVGLKDALARGLESVIQVDVPDDMPVDGHVTARVLAAAIRTVQGVDLVLTTEGAADTYAHETAPRLAELLGWAVVTNAVAVEVDGPVLRATRVLDDAVEHVTCALPAVVSVVPEIAPAPIPGLKAVMAAARKPRTTIAIGDLGLDAAETTPKVRTTATAGFVAQRRHIRHEGTPREIADSLVRALDEDGVLA